MMDWELWDDPTLGHSHFRKRFYWRYNHSTRYSALRHTLLIDGRFFYDDLFWGIALSSVMDFDLSWDIVTSDGLYWSIASSFVLIELRDFDSYGLCWDVSIFNTIVEIDWFVYSDTLLYTGAYPSFGGRSDWLLTLEHLPDDMEIIGLFHVVLIAYWGIAT